SSRPQFLRAEDTPPSSAERPKRRREATLVYGHRLERTLNGHRWRPPCVVRTQPSFSQLPTSPLDNVLRQTTANTDPAGKGEQSRRRQLTSQQLAHPPRLFAAQSHGKPVVENPCRRLLAVQTPRGRGKRRRATRHHWQTQDLAVPGGEALCELVLWRACCS